MATLPTRKVINVDGVNYVAYYHGTKNNTIQYGDELEMRASANGFGLFLTQQAPLAGVYGRVITMWLPISFVFDECRMEETNGVKGTASIIRNNRTYLNFLECVLDTSELPTL